MVFSFTLIFKTGNHRAGLNMTEGVIGDMWELGVRESFKSKLQVCAVGYYF